MGIGALVGTVGQNPALGSSIMAFGASIIKYNPNQPESMSNQVSFNTSVTVGTFGNRHGLTASQQYSVVQGRASTAQLQPYLDRVEVGYVYGGSGDIACSNGLCTYVYTPNSLEVQNHRTTLIEHTYDLMVNASEMSELFKKHLKNFHESYYIMYHDNPYLQLRGKRDINTYRGAVRGSNSKFGYGIQYTDLIFDKNIGNGFMSEQYLKTFIHEVLHHKKWFGRTRYNKRTKQWEHTSRRNEFTNQIETFDFRVEQELEWFYQSYPPAILIN